PPIIAPLAARRAGPVAGGRGLGAQAEFDATSSCGPRPYDRSSKAVLSPSGWADVGRRADATWERLTGADPDCSPWCWGQHAGAPLAADPAIDGRNDRRSDRSLSARLIQYSNESQRPGRLAPAPGPRGPARPDQGCGPGGRDPARHQV